MKQLLLAFALLISGLTYAQDFDDNWEDQVT